MTKAQARKRLAIVQDEYRRVKRELANAVDTPLATVAEMREAASRVYLGTIIALERKAR